VEQKRWWESEEEGRRVGKGKGKGDGERDMGRE